MRKASGDTQAAKKLNPKLGFHTLSTLFLSGLVASGCALELIGGSDDSNSPTVVTFNCANYSSATSHTEVGSGTSTDPYRICNAAQFVAWGLADDHLSEYFRLEADISLAAYPSGTDISPIGGSGNEFTGTFDGNGFSISDVNINHPSPNDDYMGLFGRIDSPGTITDLTVSNITVVGDTFVGGISGAGGNLQNITVTQANITGSTRIGGITGDSPDLSNVSFQGSVTGGSRAGGAVGFLSSGKTIEDLTIDASVNGSSDTGGAIGYVMAMNTIRRIYAKGDVTGTTNIGGIIGRVFNGSTLSDMHSDVHPVQGNTAVGGLIGEARNSSNTLTITNVVATGDAIHLVTTNHSAGGLFGTLYEATVTNSYATGNVNGTRNLGGLAGFLDDSSISQSFASGTITSTVSTTTGYGTGGLVGYNTGEAGHSISDSYASGTINNGFSGGASPGAGGLVGYNRGIIQNSYSRSTVNTPGFTAGGLVGLNWTDQTAPHAVPQINDSFSIGVATATNPGGLVGEQAGTGAQTPIIDNETRWDGDSSTLAIMCGWILAPEVGCNNANRITGDATYFYSQLNLPQSGWDFASTWKYPAAGNHLPILQWQNEYTAFVTSSTSNGNLGGSSGADIRCQTAAQAGGLANPSSYVAILSTGTQSAREKIRVNGPVYDVAGNLVAEGLWDFWNANLSTALQRDETGALVASTQSSFTDSSAAGVSAGNHCNDWTSDQAADSATIGDITQTNGTWISNGTDTCDQMHRLYCISQFSSW